MMRRLGALMIGLSLIALLAAACTKAAPLPAPTPRPQATATPVPAATLASPRLSPASREALVDLARKHQKITEEWERFHVELDQWREGLPACDVSSMQRGLRGFAGDFSKITGLARALPRSPHVRKLGDKLSKAAEEEEDTFRELGDTWQPNSQRPFEKVDQQRAVAAAVQIEIEDALLDLREKTSPASRASAEAFSEALKEISALWDAFHKSYDIFRSEQVEMTSAQTAGRLSGLVAQFAAVATQVRDLPISELTRPVADILVNVVQEEDLALRKLQDAFVQNNGTLAKTEAGENGSGSESTQATGTTSEKPSPQPAFEKFDAQLVKSNTRRREAAEKLAEMLKGPSAEMERAVDEFAKSHARLLSSWKAFEQAYEEWRLTEGGCDQSKARETLAQFTVRFSKLANDVRSLPRSPIFQPLGEVLVEAAEREEQALRSLRYAWRPFDSGVYSAFDQERSATSKLRRQAAAGLNQLLTLYEVSPQELVQ